MIGGAYGDEYEGGTPVVVGASASEGILSAKCVERDDANGSRLTRSRGRLATLVVALFLLSACSAPAPGGAAVASGSAAVPTAAPQTSPIATSNTAGQASNAGASASWDDLVAAAKREGTVSVGWGPVLGPSAAEVLPPAFKEKYGIDVEMQVGPSDNLVAKLQMEQTAGLHTIDVVVGGANTMYQSFYNGHMLAPLQPEMLDPDALDPSGWASGHPWFMDPQGQYVLRVANGRTGSVGINTDLVNRGDLTSWNDLLKPQFAGKIEAYDPCINGTGAQIEVYLALTLGTDYVKQLLAQNITFSRDSQQMSDWLARGNYPIWLGMDGSYYPKLKDNGLPVDIIPGFSDAPGMLSAGDGLLAMVNGAPHPNAAALFANWMATDAGQTVFNQATGFAATRTSVDSAWVPDYTLPKPGVNYTDTYSWDYAMTQYPQMWAQVKQLAGC